MVNGLQRMVKKGRKRFQNSKEYQSKLNSEGWCLSENTYDKSIGKIKEVEPEILRMLRKREEKSNNSKAIAELQQKTGIRTKSSSMQSGRTGKYKDKDKNQFTPKPNGAKDENGYYRCGNCGKTHKGVCRKPVLGATTDRNTPRKDWMTKKATQQYIKTMVASESKKKIRKGKKKRRGRYSSDSSGSESSSSEGTRSWRSGMSGAEQMHMIAAARLDPDDSDIEFDPEDERRYRKQAKKWSRSRGKRRRR